MFGHLFERFLVILSLKKYLSDLKFKILFYDILFYDPTQILSTLPVKKKMRFQSSSWSGAAIPNTPSLSINLVIPSTVL